MHRQKYTFITNNDVSVLYVDCHILNDRLYKHNLKIKIIMHTQHKEEEVVVRAEQ